MKRQHASIALLLALAACKDGPNDPKSALTLEIRKGSAAFEEETITPNAVLTLTAVTLNEARKEVSGTTVRWRTTDGDVARVSSTGTVTGVAPGVAQVIATAGARADTARINVAEPVAGSIACASGAPRPDLAVGEAFEVSAYDAVTLCADGGGLGAEYLLVPFHGSQVPGASLAVNLTATGVGLSAPVTSQRPVPDSWSEPGGPALDRGFHLRLRERALPSLTRRMRDLHSAGGASFTTRAARVPAVGDLLRLNVQVRGDDGCEQPEYRTARVMAVTTRALVVADTTNPEAFTAADYREFGLGFDNLVHPLGVQYFGEPSDIDGNQRAVLFFTRAVNDLTTRGSGFYYAGFFYDRDLFPRTGDGACAGSNEAEMFYLMVPDPARASQGEPQFSADNVRRTTLTVVGHEFQHLINASRRLHVNTAPVWEETWLNEGLSHIAEELLFYQASGLAPRRNLDGSGFTDAQVEAFRTFQLQNEERLLRYLSAPHTSSPIASDDALATRGSAWSMLRYLADRKASDERTFWHGLVNSRTSGLDNLADALDASPRDWMRDWAVSTYADDAGFPVESRFRQPSWNHRALLQRLSSLGGSRDYLTYPLRTHGLTPDQTLSLQLQAGAAAYARFSVPPGQTAAIRTTSRDLPAPSTLRLVLLRTR